MVKIDPDNRWIITNVGYVTANSKLDYKFDFDYSEYIGNVEPAGDCQLFTSLEEAEAAQQATPSIVPNLQSKYCVGNQEVCKIKRKHIV